ncbi:MAG: cytochrome c [Proteobacteria bacterium]|nr:cytochrome c [Pseudomonadota bacterium]
MKSGIYCWVVVIFLLCMVSGAVIAEEANEKQINGLRLVMQGLLEDTQQITTGIFLQDFSQIEVAANKIANHPSPGMATKTKLIANLGGEMGKFKQFDTLVHNTAVKLSRAASNEDMTAIITAYHQLIDDCQACHAEFKQRIIKILE